MPDFRRILGILLYVSWTVADGSLPPVDNTGWTQSTSLSPSATAENTPPRISETTHLSQINDATCSSGTVNYITRTLPQQCLRSGRSSLSSTFQSNPESLSSASTTTEESARNSQTDSALGLSGSSESAVSGQNDQISTSESLSASSISSTVTSASPATDTDAADSESDSVLDNANFLSFEEWKKQNLAKVGQSPDDIGRGQPVQPNRQRPDIANAFDTLGEETEISLDFIGFGGSAHIPQARSSSSGDKPQASAGDVHAADLHSSASPALRSKDAGKTCKERTNYASFDCAATVLKSNQECKSASSVLIENKDSYMLNKCSASNKFFIVELCNDILVDTVVLANYEFFSSGFRHFRLSVSDRYPVKIDKWRDLGTFEARNTREIQAFLVENPLIWARYLRVELLTHYGSEYYCPVSLLRVHGTTMLEEFRHQEEVVRGDDEDLSLEVSDSPAHQDAVPGIALDDKTRESSSVADKSKEATLSQLQTEALSTSSDMTDSDTVHGTLSANDQDAATSSRPTSVSDVDKPSNSNGEAISEPASESSSQVLTTDSIVSVPSSPSKVSHSARSSGTVVAIGSDAPIHSSRTVVNNVSMSDAAMVSAAANTSDSLSATSNSTDLRDNSTLNSTYIHEDKNQISSTTNASRVATPTAVSSTPSPQPSTQESFFKTVHKRLQQLESNSTLSLQYIEQQSRILRDAFSKVEKRQLASTTAFLSNLNQTVLSELQGFRQAYDQLWQSTVLELDGQREQYQREMRALSTRLAFTADELLWQKRMGIVQSTLLLLCLSLVLFGRTGSGSGVRDVPPLVSHVVSRSSAALARAGWPDVSPPVSASPDQRSPVSLFRRKLWRTGVASWSPAESSGSGDVSETASVVDAPAGGSAPGLQVQPPTSGSESGSGVEDEFEDDEAIEEEAEGEAKQERRQPGGDHNRSDDTVGWASMYHRMEQPPDLDGLSSIDRKKPPNPVLPHEVMS